MSQKLDILGVQAFVAIAELGSFGNAAAQLNLSQPALSRRLSNLEDLIGCVLIARTTRSVTLTQAGSDFLPRAKRIVHELGTALQELSESTAKGVGHVVIGCLPTVAASLLSTVISAYGNLYPRNRIQILDRSATEIREAVLNDEAEFGVSVLPSPHPKLHREVLFEDPIVVACPSSHTMAKHRELRWHDLEGLPLIGVGALSGLRLQTESVMSRQSLNLNFAYEVQHLATALGLVIGGAGIAILPLGACASVRDTNLTVVRLKSPKVSRSIELFRKHQALSAAASPLYDLIRKALRKRPNAIS